MSSVLIVGTDRVDSLESCYGRAFAKRGFEVRYWDPAVALYRNVVGGRLGRRIATSVWMEPAWNEASLELLRLVQDDPPDLILVIYTIGVRAGTLAQIRATSPQIPLYCIFPDGPHQLQIDRILALRMFDRVAASSPAWVGAFERMGAERVHFLPFAADVEIHQPPGETAATTGTSRHDVAFIGSWRPEREEFLEALCDFDLAIWGGQWKAKLRRGSPLRDRFQGGWANGPAFAEVCHHTKILLNVMDVVSRPGPNMRTFELPACRAFALSERSPAVLELFCEGESIACFDGIAEAREKIRHYLDNEAERERIAHASLEFILSNGHTYADRVQTVLDWLAEDTP